MVANPLSRCRTLRVRVDVVRFGTSASRLRVGDAPSSLRMRSLADLIHHFTPLTGAFIFWAASSSV
jgi:hypothetical protein